MLGAAVNYLSAEISKLPGHQSFVWFRLLRAEIAALNRTLLTGLGLMMANDGQARESPKAAEPPSCVLGNKSPWP